MIDMNDPIYIRARHSKWNRWLKVATLASIAFVAVAVIAQWRPL